VFPIERLHESVPGGTVLASALALAVAKAEAYRQILALAPVGA